MLGFSCCAVTDISSPSADKYRYVQSTISGTRDGYQNGIDKPVTAVLFDMDNTLFDLVRAKQEACRAVVATLPRGTGAGLFEYFLRPERGFEDPGNIEDFQKDHGCYTPESYRECVEIYREVKLAHIEPYPGVPETLRALKGEGVRTALVTDAHSRDAIPRLEKSGLHGFFDRIITHDMTWEKKPSPIPFLYALQRIGAGPDGTMLVGDSPRRDIAPARRLGMITVYARYGDRFSRTRGDGGATHVIDDMRDLLPLANIKPPDPAKTRRLCADDSPSR